MRHATRGRPEALLLLVALAALASWSWRSWPDPLVDFGRELYGAWRVALGEVPGRDLAWLSGPLSVEWNGLLMRVFGVSAGTIFIANLGLLAAIVLLLHRRALQLGDRFGALLAIGFFLPVLAFGVYGGINNYTYAAPYAHELTHGLLLGLICLALLDSWFRGGRRKGVALSGVVLGLCLLTKLEMFAATAGAVLVRLAAGGGGAERRRSTAALLLGAGAALPPLIAWAAYARVLGASEAGGVVLGALTGFGHPELYAMPFYRAGLGLTDPASSIDRLVSWALAWTLLAAVSTTIALGARGALGRRAPIAPLGLVLGFLPLWLVRKEVHWFEAARPLPLAALTLFVLTLIKRLRATQPEQRSELGARLAWIAFAGLALAKMALNARLVHYGFVLAAPATVLVVLATSTWLPRWVDQRGGSGRLLRALMLGLWSATACAYFETSAEWNARKTSTLGAGADRLRVASRGQIAAQALAEIEGRITPDQTLLVLPEGIMLNYLARRASPTRFLNFMPPELVIFGQPTMLAALEASAPDLIAIVHKDTSEYGYRFFGRDYGQQLAAWVGARYEPVALFGEPPLVDRGFGITLLAPRP